MASRIHSHLLRLNPQVRRKKGPVHLPVVAGSFVILALVVLFWLGRFHAR